MLKYKSYRMIKFYHSIDLIKLIQVSLINTAKSSFFSFAIDKIRDYGVLMKFKLSLTVVFSAVMAYMIALDGKIVLSDIVTLFLGGLFTSGSASALNQILDQR